MVTFTTLWANSADDRLLIFLFFSQKTGFNILCKLSGDNLHEMLKPVFWEKKKKYFKMSSAENFTQSAKP